MVFSIAKFNEVYFVKRNLWLLKKIALQKRHSLSAPEEEGTRALPHRIGRSRLNHQTLLSFSFTNTNHSYDPVQRQRSIFKRKGPVGKVGDSMGSSYTTPSVYIFLYSNFPECRLHSYVEQKAISLLVTLTVSGSFIIKFLTCRRRSCFMFLVSSRVVVGRKMFVSNDIHS